MPSQPPSFGSQQYWDARFTSNSHPFEWLEAPTVLDPYLTSALHEVREERPEILHIGCGTSLLSFHLREHVKDPEQIHNLDYSDVAVQVGRKREVELYDVKEQGTKKEESESKACSSPTGKSTHANESTNNDRDEQPKSLPSQPTPADPLPKKYTRWSAADLLSHTSLLAVCKPATYPIIIDKSTCDSIACADDIYVPLPYPVSTSSPSCTPETRSSHSQLSQSPEPIHPLHILAIHLALVAKPGARWISLSYSQDRYPFLHRGAASAGSGEGNRELHDDIDDIPKRIIESGLPDPGTLWTLVGKHEIEVPQQLPPSGLQTTHQPRLLHWVYVMQRTDVEVFVK